MGFINQMGTLYREWGIRLMVLLSLLFQVLLQLLGNRRKFSCSVWLKIVVWFTYVSADSVATLALGMISTKLGRIDNLSQLDGETKLNVLWAPCLLVLLGGPDSITSYSVEDNELWLRHVLGLVSQTSVTGYLCFLAWAADCPSYLSLVLLVLGVVKYGERVWVLRQVSFAKLRATYSLALSRDWTRLHSFEGNELVEGYTLFKIFKHIFLNQKLDPFYRTETMDMFKTRQKAFKIIEIELGFMYDLLHTKAKTTYTCWGIFRRLMTSTISCIVLGVFSWFVTKTASEVDYPRIDVAVTFVLLATNILSEIYWVCMLLSSDWSEVVWIMKQESWFSKLWTSKKNVVRNTLLRFCRQPRWSNSAGQLSFFSLFFCDEDRLLKRLNLHDTVGPYYYAQHQEITDYIKGHIFMMTTRGDLEHDARLQTFPNYKELLKYACEDVVRPAHVSLDNELKEEYDFADRVTIWHIATELCYYYCDHHENPSTPPHSDERSAAMLLSRYMFYILVRYPSMLQTVNSYARLRDVRYELQFRNRWKGGLENAKQMVDAVIDQIPYMTRPNGGAPERSYVAIKLANKLMMRIDGGEGQHPDAWRFLLNSWVAHLIYAAYNCNAEYHTQQLRRGGELLTHVWMLLAHLRLTDHLFEKIYGNMTS